MSRKKDGVGEAFIPVELRVFEPLKEGKISVPAFAAMILLLKQCDWETGIWIGSAYRLKAESAHQVDQRTTRRWLEEVAEAKLIKSFYKKGSKLDYAILIHDYCPRFGALAGYRLDAHNSTDPKNPIYLSPSRTQVSLKDHITDTSRTPSRTQVSVKDTDHGHVTDTITDMSRTQVSGNTPDVPEVHESPDNQEVSRNRLPDCQPDAAAGSQSGSTLLSSSLSKEKQEQKRWLEFVRELDDVMRYAVPTVEQRTAVLAQLDATGGGDDNWSLADAINEWADLQSPPLTGLQFGRWKRWLETGDAKFQDALESAEWEKKKV